ncbi:MAG: hypothetical protein E7273_13095 [Pseudobutyrivibrio ruminis]|nr:hypothetical protein [Pseudobutyrivibrio ruminis]
MSITKKELLERQSWPLWYKVDWSKMQIDMFLREYSEKEVYISFSGGKDSRVLTHLVREVCGYRNVTAVFLDTWMEYPEIRQFVKTFDNVETIKPDKSMKQIIADCGWNFPSKDIAELIEALRKPNPPKWAINKINGLDKNGNYSEYRQMYKKWKVLVDAPFKISRKCCQEMKEKPVQKWEKKTGKHPILGLMADESANREKAYLKSGCLTFGKTKEYDVETGEWIIIGSDRPMARPMGFWTENDVLQYIYENKLSIAAPYGDIIEVGQIEGQMNLFDVGAARNCEGCKFRTTGEQRTGCMFCPVGCHLDGFAKFKRLKQTHPKLYEYCMDELGEREVLSWIDRNIVQKSSEKIIVA